MYRVWGFIDALSNHAEMFPLFKTRKHLKSASSLSISLPGQFLQPIREKYANEPAVMSHTPQSQDSSRI